VRIDLCKLRPGDVIFSRDPTWVSRAIAVATGAPYSHAMIVVYPDVWFETDGAGSGFRIIEDAEYFEIKKDTYAILADLPCLKLDVLRPVVNPSPVRVLSAIRERIALRYPGLIEFLPLVFFLQPFPKFSRGLVRSLSPKSDDVGGYCSQMISQILRDLYGVSVGGPDDHISPGTLRRRLIKAGAVTRVSSIASEPADTWTECKQLAMIYRDLTKVTRKLMAYQYPHREGSFHEALNDTFESMAIWDDPKRYAIRTEDLKRMLTDAKFFSVHEMVWPGKYT